MTVNDWLSRATTQFAQISIPSPRLDAEVILAHCLNVDRSWLIAHGDDTVDTSEADDLLQRRFRREPIAYLTGHKEFYGRDFIVTPDTLIPRPESETLIELLLAHFAPGQSRSKVRILDVGTGTGCLGLTLAKEIPNADITLSDISEPALAVARQNADTLGVTATFVVSDLLAHWTTESAEVFDIIVSNLPYVDGAWDRSPETDHEPSTALFADAGGLALINRLIVQAGELLDVNRMLLLEADPEQHNDIIATAKNHGFSLVESRDYSILLRKS